MPAHGQCDLTGEVIKRRVFEAEQHHLGEQLFRAVIAIDGHTEALLAIHGAPRVGADIDFRAGQIGETMAVVLRERLMEL